MESITVGIDVAKDRLDVAVRPGGELFLVERNAGGLDLLVERLRSMPVAIVALEATGGFETVVAAALAAGGLPVVVVNPAQVRAFANVCRHRGSRLVDGEAEDDAAGDPLGDPLSDGLGDGDGEGSGVQPGLPGVSSTV